jgi:phospholipid/cholesterol/gamma-HCH transport system substrate-binding protein
MARIRIRKRWRRLVGLFSAAVVVVGCSSCGGQTSPRASNYCAMLPDAIGLYVGNPVTQMGLQIGTVNHIDARSKSVRVDFSVTDSRPMPNDVRAAIRSASIVADRALELVGNYHSGPKLQPGECIPLSRSSTPKSLSELIDSANTFVTGISPQDSSNVGDSVSLLEQAVRDNGAGINEILTTTSRLLDNPDAPISDLGAIVDNLADLTKTLVQLRGPLKQVLEDSVTTTPYIPDVLKAAKDAVIPLGQFLYMLSDLEIHAGETLQSTLDAVSDVLRINTPHAPGWVSVLGGILKPLPWWINTAANHFNNREFHVFYRPPLYRIRTPNGPLVCAMMNSSMPGSCANVAGQPYGVDINLLQYVFTEASR